MPGSGDRPERTRTHRSSSAVAKGAADRPGATGSTCPPARARLQGVGGSGTRTPAWRNDSWQWRAATRLEILIGAPAGLVQVPRQDIGLDLSIPSLGDELLEPGREAGQLIAGK